MVSDDISMAHHKVLDTMSDTSSEQSQSGDQILHTGRSTDSGIFGGGEIYYTSTMKHELPPVIPLNVGGFRFHTRRTTLCRYHDSMLATMFNGNHKLDQDTDGYYFIDSSGEHFSAILDFLRHDRLPIADITEAVYKEACYYHIVPLIEKLQLRPAIANNVVLETHRAQFPAYNDIKDNIIRIAMEQAVVNKVGEVRVYAFRKEFVPRTPNFRSDHECIAETAHMTVGPWHGLADEEQLMRCVENDLVEDGFRIKPLEQRKRCKYYNGQNCQKAIYRITIMFN